MARIRDLRGQAQRAVEGVGRVELVLPHGGIITAVLPFEADVASDDALARGGVVCVTVGDMIMLEAPAWSLVRYPKIQPIEAMSRQRVLVVSPGRVCVRYTEFVDLL